MQLKYLATGIFCSSIVLILMFSSFRKPSEEITSSESCQPLPASSTKEMPDDNQSYNSEAKVVNRSGGMTLSSAFENDYFTPTHTEGYYYTELEAVKMESEEGSELPLNISIVIDRSGSMAGMKLINAKQAAKHVIDNLRYDDYVSLVIYDGSVNLLHVTTRVNNKRELKRRIDGITSRGGTNLMGGAQMGYDQVKQNYKSGYINRVLLLSDGQANEGITDPQQIDRIVRTQNTMNGISISTFGLGNDYNEDLMTAMAESGTGNYYFISNAQDIASIFEKELNGLKEVVAQNAKIEITIPENVSVVKVFGHAHDQVGRKLYIHLRDVFSEEKKGILVKYRMNRSYNYAQRFTSSLSFRNVATERNASVTNTNTIEFTNRNDLYMNSFNEWVSAQVALYESNQRLELAMKEVDKGNYKKAKDMVEENKVYMQSKAPLVQKSVELQASQTNNNSYNEKLEQVESMADEDKKYMQKSYKSTNYEIRAKKK